MDFWILNFTVKLLSSVSLSSDNLRLDIKVYGTLSVLTPFMPKGKNVDPVLGFV
jgi:hypothetical protein